MAQSLFSLATPGDQNSGLVAMANNAEEMVADHLEEGTSEHHA